MVEIKQISERQLDFVGRVRALNDEFAEREGRKRRAFCETYGCQQNVADSEKISGLLKQMGYDPCDSAKDADIIIINTCAVREHAELRVFGNIGELSHLKKDNPELIIAVCGCMVQQQHIADKIKKSFSCVDIVFGTHALPRLPEIIYKKLTEKKRIFDIEDDKTRSITEGIPSERKPGVKAWLSIMYGCDNFCTYCIVPYVRGRERSRSFDDIMTEFRQLLADGYKDITLLGQNVNSYGKGLEQGIDFPELLDRLASCDGDFVLRFMTSHPKDASDRLFEVMAKHDKIAKHIHLPFQSGSDGVLQRMNRRYTAEDYLKLVRRARELMPDISITSDVIVGFPDESDADFEKTVELIKKVGFSSLFTFIYSKRNGTPAAQMPNPITDRTKHIRFDRLVSVQNDISLEQNRALVGKTMRVLADGIGKDAEYTVSARTDGGRLVYVKATPEVIGRFIDVKIDKCSSFALFGQPA